MMASGRQASSAPSWPAQPWDEIRAQFTDRSDAGQRRFVPIVEIIDSIAEQGLRQTLRGYRGHNDLLVLAKSESGGAGDMEHLLVEPVSDATV